MKRITVLVALQLLFAIQLAAAQHGLVFFNNIARPMGMGGAYTAVQDSMLTHLYNPAAAKFPDKPAWDISFDLTRAIYIFAMVTDGMDLDDDDDDDGTGTAIVLTAVGINSFLLSVANITFSTDTWFFKINFLDQLITQGPDFPMYSSSANIGCKFHGPLTGFQTGVSGQLYNLGSPSLPQGYSVSWGLYYRPRDCSPFSLGLFYFHASDDMPWIRRPFEQIMNNTFNFGAAFRTDSFTMSFDLRNINNFNLDAYCQPHFGMEKILYLGKESERKKYTLALRAGAYYDSVTRQMGVSGGLDFRIYFKRPGTLKILKIFERSGYFYLNYSLTREEDVPAYNRVLSYNHIIACGLVF